MNLGKYRELYFNHWEAKKIIEIPVVDALRKKYQILNIDEEKINVLMKESRQLHIDSIIRSALMLERLDGGCVILIKNKNSKQKIEELDVITRDAIGYFIENNEIKFQYNGEYIDQDRIILFKGFCPFTVEEFGVTQLFSPSVLQPIYADILKAIGIRESVYRLTQKSSVIMALVDNFTTMNQTKANQIKNALNKIGNDQAIILDEQNVKLEEFTTSFGALPDLISIYQKILASALDVPVTRFLGISNSGLTQSSDGDLENYYNMLQGYQESHIVPRLEAIYRLIYKSIWGEDQQYEAMQIQFPPLWNLSEKEHEEKNKNMLARIMDCLSAGLMTKEEAIKEINSKHIFSFELSGDRSDSEKR